MLSQQRTSGNPGGPAGPFGTWEIWAPRLWNHGQPCDRAESAHAPDFGSLAPRRSKAVHGRDSALTEPEGSGHWRQDAPDAGEAQLGCASQLGTISATAGIPDAVMPGPARGKTPGQRARHRAPEAPPASRKPVGGRRRRDACCDSRRVPTRPGWAAAESSRHRSSVRREADVGEPSPVVTFGPHMVCTRLNPRLAR